MVHWASSYKYGKQQEEKVLPVITEYFKRAITSTEGQYAKYDYVDDSTNYELKSRTNKMKAYPTTMITCNKFNDLAKPLILIFNFTDALAYIEYDAEKFSTYTTSLFSRAGCCWDEKAHVYIPVEHLSVIKEW
tara:strand:+ start:205 stop:603 length:399 start_codon:yes stop_codon:yes gene_type:complete